MYCWRSTDEMRVRVQKIRWYWSNVIGGQRNRINEAVKDRRKGEIVKREWRKEK